MQTLWWCGAAVLRCAGSWIRFEKKKEMGRRKERYISLRTRWLERKTTGWCGMLMYVTKERESNMRDRRSIGILGDVMWCASTSAYLYTYATYTLH